ncbi:MAG: hypothetical protein IPH20_15865 [Bacteroidales bacterium]|nr:hypothetical protein [Bacteroidales bacterium]
MTPVDNNSAAFVAGYIPTDVNGDGMIDTGDMPIIDNNSADYVTAAFPASTNTLPTVNTAMVTNITTTTGICGGNVTSEGSSMVSARGVCWSNSPNPLATGNHTTDGNGTGSFISNLFGLIPGTLYYVRAYATNGAGTAYGNNIEFFTSLFTPGNGVTDIDGNIYTSVNLGSQEWMSENLIVTHYRNGEIIPNITDNSWNNFPSGAYCAV